MSGIIGLVNLDGQPVDRNLMLRMTNSMSFRGPDAQSIWMDGNVGLGHSLLRTTEETKPKGQPLTLDNKVWLLADARIDAQEELIQKLEGRLRQTLSRAPAPSDAELILLAFQAWDEDCIKHLIGDFAFATFDLRTRRLFCARDHFGVKPFFYAQTGSSFIFSNTLNAVRMDVRVSDTLNETAIGDYLLFGVNQDLSTTSFHDINRLPPGHTLSISGDRLKISRYWRPAKTNEVRYREPQSYVERFSELLTHAIKDRLRTSRVSVSMSGGLDSTSVAAVSAELLNQDRSVHAYSVVYDHLIPDEERFYSRVAAQHIGIPVTHISADQYSLFHSQVPDDLNQAEPFLLSALAGQFNSLLRHCADHSRVGLTGWDGDALMNEAASNYFIRAAKERKLKTLATGLGSYVSTQRRLPRLSVRTRLRRGVGQSPTAGFYPEWIDESFAKKTNLPERSEAFSREPVAGSEDRPNAMSALTSKVWASLFEGYDPGATKLPLEFRHPFIDLRLVEYLLALPAVPWFLNKHILRSAMKDRLPATILNRPKTGLAGDPALQLTRRTSVRCFDSFEVSPQLHRFVKLDRRRSIANEETQEGLWASLRVFALNYWLSNSLAIDSVVPESRVASVIETSIA